MIGAPAAGRLICTRAPPAGRFSAHTCPPLPGTMALTIDHEQPGAHALTAVPACGAPHWFLVDADRSQLAHTWRTYA